MRHAMLGAHVTVVSFELVPILKESVYQVERTRTNEKKASMSKTTRIEGQQPGVVEEIAMAIVNQMNTQRVVVGTQIKYQITTKEKHYFMESALVNGTNGWLMRINSRKLEIVGRRTIWTNWKPGPSVFFSCPLAAASAVMTTLRANTFKHDGPFYVFSGDFALLEFDPQLQNAEPRLEAILRTPPVHPVTPEDEDA